MASAPLIQTFIRINTAKTGRQQCNILTYSSWKMISKNQNLQGYTNQILVSGFWRIASQIKITCTNLLVLCKLLEKGPSFLGTLQAPCRLNRLNDLFLCLKACVWIENRRKSLRCRCRPVKSPYPPF